MTTEDALTAPAPLGPVERMVRPNAEAPTLVERLRTRPTGDPYLHMMVHEAADEIERLEQYASHCEEVISAHNAVGARQEAAILRMRTAGGMLANVAYNLAQKPGHALTSDDVAMLDKLRREWDAALKA